MAQPAGNLSSVVASAKKHVCPSWPDDGRTRILRNHHAMERGAPPGWAQRQAGLNKERSPVNV
jgi:hypothetical protein